MTKRCSVSEAKDKFTRLLREVESGKAIEITRRGKPVALFLSAREYDRLIGRRRGLTETLDQFRKKRGFKGVDLPPDYFEKLKDRSPGRDVEL